MATSDYSRLRAAQADRERAVDVLKAAFAEGRLDQDEFAERVELAYRARTYADLGELTDDLPAGPLGALPPPPTAAQVVPYPPPYWYPARWPEVPEPDEPPLSYTAGAAVALAAASPFIGGPITGPPALVLAFWAVADITGGRRSGAFWAFLALLFGAVGTGLFIADWSFWAHLLVG